MKKEQQKKMLSDHKQIGKRFIPPWLDFTGTDVNSLEKISWINCRLPELLWLGLLNKYHGLKIGAELAVSLAKTTNNVCDDSEKKLFASISSFTFLSSEQKKQIVLKLDDQNHLESLQKALLPFFYFYPKCPLNFLYENISQTAQNTKKLLEEFKELLSNLYDRHDQPATLVQANAVYIAFALKMILVNKGLALANFPEVANYPRTEESKKVAAAVQTTCPILFNDTFYDKTSFWPSYFWNRGLEIEKCDFPFLREGDLVYESE